jgi:polyphosphate glucokinase
VKILGIDIGGSGIKGAPVDVTRGELLAERHRISTPQPSTPDAVGDTVAAITAYFGWTGTVGCTFPAVIKKGIAYSAANVDDSWIGVNGKKLLQKKTGCSVLLINDADAAGIAEMQFGAGKNRSGVVFMLTFGTGIGSAIFVDGVLVPNTELGHIQIRCRKSRGVEAEDYASDRARKDDKLNWREWAERVKEYLGELETLFSPDLFIVGGGVSKKHRRFLPFLDVQTEVVPAQMLNEAGIVGAALAARALRSKSL